MGKQEDHINGTAVNILPLVPSNGGAIDHYGQKITLFKDVRSILAKLNEIGIALAAASRYV